METGTQGQWLLSVRGPGVDGTHGEAVYLGPQAHGGNCLCEETLEETPGCTGCFMPRGRVAAYNWVFVGAGRGKYEPMQRFSYVGEGQGRWDKQEFQVSTGWRFQKCAVALLALLLLGGLFLLVCGWMSDSLEMPAVVRNHMLMHTSAKTLIAGSTMAPFDCAVGRRWPPEKKAWCCQNRGLGCTTVAPPSSALPERQPATRAYDCDNGHFGWEEAWSKPKQAWCCRHRSRACHADAPPSTTPPPPAVTAPLTTVVPFDCDAGYTTCVHCLKQRWSVGKRAWCCRHTYRGCPTTPPLSYDCDAGYTTSYDSLEQRWSAAKRTWCCVHGGRGCSTTSAQQEPRDCGLRVGNWVMPWSESKLSWCCRHEGVGCQNTTSVAPPGVAEHRFDCGVGLPHWERGWSVAKKVWCCAHEDRGCSTHATTTSLPYDCDVDFSTCEPCLRERWSASKRAWCCQHGGRGCPMVEDRGGFR